MRYHIHHSSSSFTAHQIFNDMYIIFAIFQSLCEECDDASDACLSVFALMPITFSLL
jgi:hypothetical protein